SLLDKACEVVSYYVNTRYAEMKKDKLKRPCGHKMLSWRGKLEEQVYTMDKKQEINLENKDYDFRNVEITIKTAMESNSKNSLGVFLDRAEAVAEVLTTERQVW
ncbi:hypothetical protein IGI04_013094, partial [Brassica rapa subsp. trilocularis]